MKLPAHGVEYVTWTLVGDFSLTGTIDFLLSDTPTEPATDAVWTSASWLGSESVVGATHTRAIQVLLAGRTVDPVPALATQLTVGQNYAYVRLTDTPEVIIRAAGKVEGL